MKFFELREAAGIEALTLTEWTTPKPGPGEALVRLKAASLNYRDLVVIEGGYGKGVKLPLTPLSDGAGEVAETGPGVTRVKVGDRVAGIFMQRWLAGAFREEYGASALGGAIDGMLAEYVALREEGLVSIPEHLSWEEAATLPCSAVTAWNGLMVSGGLRAGETVLVLGSGGVSVFGLQFARMAGARVIATSSSDEKLQRLRELGAWQLINYRETPKWGRRVRELTGGAGVDHILEVGGAGTLEQSLRAVRAGGEIAVIGVLAGPGEFNPNWIFAKAVRLQGIYVGSREMFEQMNRAIAAAEMRPVVDRVFPFAEARDALRYLKAGSHLGKVVIRFED